MYLRISLKSFLLSILVIVTVLKSNFSSLIIKDVMINGLTHKIMASSDVVNGVNIEYFAKIPYAKPPIGDLRFKHPQPIDGKLWTGLYNTSVQPATCWQPEGGDFDKLNAAARIWLSKTPMSEDCLYLTIWVPKLSMTKLPVMVWIYGGSFLSGSSTLEVYDGSILASKHNVIVVSFQYRVGPLGFLYIDENSAPGNQGLMDQRLALKWIKDNIKSFNGDEEKITIFGESAGSASVSFHVLSPLSQNLFNRAIMESGSALAPWAVETKEDGKTKSIQLAKYANCGSVANDNYKLLTCLSSIDPATLVNLQFSLKESVTKQRLNIFKKRKFEEMLTDGSYFLDIFFRPIYDNFFIPSDVTTLLSKQSSRKKVDLLMGFNANEGMYFLIYGLHKWLKFLDKGKILNTDLLSSSNPNLIRASKLILENLSNPRFAYKSLIPLFLYEYRVPSTILGYKHWSSLQVLSALDQLTGDELFVCPVVNFAATLAENNQKVFLFNFIHRTEAMTFPKWTGTMHGYEIEYLFGMPFSDRFKNSYYSFTESEQNLSEQVMTLWTNFAKFGNPTPTPLNYFGHTVSWLPYNISEPQMFHFSITKDSPFKRNEKSNKCRFWSRVLPSLIAEFSGERALKQFLPFVTTYLFERFFSLYMATRIKHRNRLDADNDMYVQLTSIHPDIDFLCSEN